MIMAMPVPAVASRDCTGGSTYRCAAAATYCTTDDCARKRAASRLRQGVSQRYDRHKRH
jgi:hypothetical protein